MIDLFSFDDKKLNKQQRFESLLSLYLDSDETDFGVGKSVIYKYGPVDAPAAEVQLNSRSIIHWYKTTEYYKKYSDLKRLEKIWRTTSVGWIENSLYSPDPQKHSFLENLIKISANLSQSYNEDDEAIFLSLLSEFYQNITPYEVIILNASGIVNSENLSLAEIYKKIIHYKILQIGRSMFRCPKPDLKMFFRKIIQFRFKNMDDEAHANNHFVQILNKNRLLHHLNFYKWTTVYGSNI